jgi:hypothetical protein
LLGLRPVYESDQPHYSSFAGVDDAASRELFEAIPDPALLEEMLEYARRGDVLALRAAITRLSASGDVYGPFVERLSLLARQYRMSALVKVIEAAIAKGQK